MSEELKAQLAKVEAILMAGGYNNHSGDRLNADGSVTCEFTGPDLPKIKVVVERTV